MRFAVATEGGQSRWPWAVVAVAAAILAGCAVFLTGLEPHRAGMMQCLKNAHTAPAGAPAVAAVQAALRSAAGGAEGQPAAAPATSEPAPAPTGASGSVPDSSPAPPPAPQTFLGQNWRSSPHVAHNEFKFQLTPRELQRGVLSYGDPARARRALSKLLRGEPIIVSVIGGSTAYGAGASKRGVTDFAAVVFAWINATFPAAAHKMVNGAVGGISSEYFVLCHSWHVQADADLVIIELNVNDSGVGALDVRRLAHERLLRTLLVGYHHRPAVVEFLHYITPWPYLPSSLYNVPYPSDIRRPYRWYQAGEDEMMVFASYYRLPTLSIRSMTWGQNGLPEVLPNGSAATQGFPEGKFRELWFDGMGHPTDQGHRWLAELVIFWIQQTLEDLTRFPLEAEDEQITQEALPFPHHPGNYAAQHELCFPWQSLAPLIVSNQGFELIDEGKAQKEKWGYVATTPGSTIRLALNTNVGGGIKPGENVTLVVAYLESYEHMGWFSVACVEGCSCDPAQQDGLNPEEKSSKLRSVEVSATAVDSCHVQVTVLDQTSAPSGETKVKLLAVMISDVHGHTFGSGYLFDGAGAIARVPSDRDN